MSRSPLRFGLASQESVELPTETPVQLLEPQGVDENGRAGMGIGDSGDQDRTEYFEVPVLVRPSEDALTRFPQESRTRASEATATLGEMTQTTDSGPSIAKPDVAQDGDYGRDLQMSSQKGSVEEQVLRGDGQDAAPQRVRDSSEKDEAPPASKSATNEDGPTPRTHRYLSVLTWFRILLLRTVCHHRMGVRYRQDQSSIQAIPSRFSRSW